MSGSIYNELSRVLLPLQFSSHFPLPCSLCIHHTRLVSRPCRSPCSLHPWAFAYAVECSPALSSDFFLVNPAECPKHQLERWLRCASSLCFLTGTHPSVTQQIDLSCVAHSLLLCVCVCVCACTQVCVYLVTHYIPR